MVAGRLGVRMLVQPEQAVNIGAGEIFHDVDLVVDSPTRREMFAGRVV